jgi:Ca2+-binding RTX toxin-like protein
MTIIYGSTTNKDDIIDGSTTDDVIDAGSGNDLVFGNAGNDRLLGGNGNDKVFGGSGDDIIGTLNADATIRNAGSGDNGGDLLVGDGFEDHYMVNLAAAMGADVIYGGNGKDTIWGDNANNATGTTGGGQDILYAGNGDDLVYGEGGSDVLVGENGADILVGGANRDFFVYNAAGESTGSNYDTIKDFHGINDPGTATEQDKIDLRPLLTGGYGAVAGGTYSEVNTEADTAKLNWGSQTQTAKGVWFQHIGTDTFVYADTDGNLGTGTSGAELVIKLEGVHQLTNTDFLGVKNTGPTTTLVTLTAIAEDSGARLITQAQLLANASDPDSSTTLTATNLTISSGNGTLIDNGNGTWTYTPALNDDSAVSLSYQITDGAATVNGTATLDITRVNDAPTAINLSGSSVAENNTAGALVATLTADDVDSVASGFASPFTFELVTGTGDTDNGAFTISGNELHIAGSANFEVQDSYSIRVKVTDAGGESYETTKVITVTNVDEAPSVTSGSTGSVAENAAVSTIVYTATASDPDTTAPNNTISWSLTGTDQGAFTIDSGGNVRLNSSANYEVKNSYSINVVATDGGSPALSSSKAVTVSVTDEDDTVSLTTGTDSIAFSAKTNTVNGVIGTSATLNIGDTLAGGTGTDSLVLTGSGGSAIASINLGTGSFSGGSGNITGFENVDASGYTGTTALTITGGTGSNTLKGGGGNDTITGGTGNDTMTGSGGSDTFVFAAGDSGQTSGNTDVITGYAAGAVGTGDKFDYGATNLTIGGSSGAASTNEASINNSTGIATFASGSGTTFTDAVSDVAQRIGNNDSNTDPGEFAFFKVNGTGNYYLFISDTTQGVGSGDVIVELQGIGTITSITLSSGDLTITAGGAPVGIAGQPINLALTNASELVGEVTVTITNVPLDWTLTDGVKNADGTWTIVTADVGSLSVITPVTYAGADVLGVTQTWTNADGTAGYSFLSNNVEAFAPGWSIFAISGDDNLTGSSGADQFVFAEPTGVSKIYGFDVAADTIDLIGFAGVQSFADVEGQIANNVAGNAVVTLGEGKSIELLGVDASAVTEGNFVFNVEPTNTNTGTITISNGAFLPLGGTIVNEGVIELNSSGAETDLQILVEGVTLTGGGEVMLSDNSGNVIFGGTEYAKLINVDNTISGAGQLGAGQLTLRNEGIIRATGSNPLIINTGSNAVMNYGTLVAVAAGGMIIDSVVENWGNFWADGGNIAVAADVVGTGGAMVSGTATLEFDGSSSVDVMFAASGSGTLKLAHAATFTGTVYGLGDGDTIQIGDLTFTPTSAVSFTANQDGNGGVLTISDGSYSANLKLAGSYAADGFAAAADSAGGLALSYVHGTQTLSGDEGNNVLVGGAGNEILVGGAGDDTLTGGLGSDVFKFGSVNDGTDALTDFAIGNLDPTKGAIDTNADVLDLHDVLQGVDGLAAAVAADDAATVRQYISFTVSGTTATLQVDADGNGAGAAAPLATFGVSADSTSASVLNTLLHNNQIVV